MSTYFQGMAEHVAEKTAEKMAKRMAEKMVEEAMAKDMARKLGEEKSSMMLLKTEANGIRFLQNSVWSNTRKTGKPRCVMHRGFHLFILSRVGREVFYNVERQRCFFSNHFIGQKALEPFCNFDCLFFCSLRLNFVNNPAHSSTSF